MSTQYYIECIDRAILVHFQHGPLKPDRLLDLQKTHLSMESSAPKATRSFPVPSHLISIC